MLIFVIILLLIIFNEISAKGKNEFFDDYCARRQTSAINGIFTILIFLSHASQYVILSGPLDDPYITLKKHLGQLVVVTFLFFSGFGIMESINKKGTDYVKSIPKNRLFKVWYHFALAVVLYIIIGEVFNKDYDLKRILLSFTGWSSIGNSSWFMLVTFAMYIIIFLSFILVRRSRVLAVILVTLLTGAFALFEYKMGLASRYYNTIMCFPAGMIYSLIKPYTDKILMKNDTIWACAFALLFGGYCLFTTMRDNRILYHIIWCFLAMALILMFSMKVQIANSILDWFGSHIFSIYILQRIPMIILYQMGYANHKYFFIIASFVLTVAIASVFDLITDKLDSLIFKSPKKLKSN